MKHNDEILCEYIVEVNSFLKSLIDNNDTNVSAYDKLDTIAYNLEVLIEEIKIIIDIL